MAGKSCTVLQKVTTQSHLALHSTEPLWVASHIVNHRCLILDRHAAFYDQHRQEVLDSIADEPLIGETRVRCIVSVEKKCIYCLCNVALVHTVIDVIVSFVTARDIYCRAYGLHKLLYLRQGT